MNKIYCRVYLLFALSVKLTALDSFEGMENVDFVNNNNNAAAFEIHNKTVTGKVLSRKRRYLVFPEGSSLQLVYCLTMPSIGVGQIFTIGSTAALAWELPHDPLVPFRKPSEVLHRMDVLQKDDSSGGWTVQNKQRPTPVRFNNMKTYYNPFLINRPLQQSLPVYNTINVEKQQRRTGGYSTLQGQNVARDRVTIYRPPTSYNAIKNSRFRSTGNYANDNYDSIENMHPVYHHVHRRTRRDLYKKIEKLFTALSRDGKACLLKAVCEVSQATVKRKGTFMEEIIKTIFRVKPHDEYQNEDEYDLAYNKSHNCTEQYPSCEYSVWTNMF